MRTQCSAIAKTGTGCLSRAVPDSHVCFARIPGLVKERERGRKQGGADNLSVGCAYARQCCVVQQGEPRDLLNPTAQSAARTVASTSRSVPPSRITGQWCSVKLQVLNDRVAFG